MVEIDISANWWLYGLAFVVIPVIVVILRRLFAKRYPISIYGCHVLVTGGSSGIGKCVAIEACRNGAHVTIVARDESQLKKSVEEISAYRVDETQKIGYISLDLRYDFELISRKLNELEEKIGPVYMLVNCAGYCICGTLETMSIEDVDSLVRTNYVGTLHTIKALIGNMKSRRKGFVVITSSQASLIGIYGLSVYSSTKFALRGLAECLHMELRPYDIGVTLAMPPDTDTPGFENEEKSKPLATSEISQTGGLCKPEEVARQIMLDALNKRFFSYVGFNCHMLTILCAGMAPIGSFIDFVFHSLIIGVLRLVSYFLQWNFARIVERSERKKML